MPYYGDRHASAVNQDPLGFYSGPAKLRHYHKARVIILMPETEAAAIDAWAIPAGYPSRTAAIRHLLALGLEIVMREPAA